MIFRVVLLITYLPFLMLSQMVTKTIALLKVRRLIVEINWLKRTKNVIVDLMRRSAKKNVAILEVMPKTKRGEILTSNIQNFE